MKNSTITWGIFGVLVILFALIMVPKYMVRENNDLGAMLTEVREAADREDWAQAQATMETLLSAWKAQKSLIALNYAEEDFSTLDDAIHHIQGAIACQDKVSVFTQSEAAQSMYDNALRIVPEP